MNGVQTQPVHQSACQSQPAQRQIHEQGESARVCTCARACMCVCGRVSAHLSGGRVCDGVGLLEEMEESKAPRFGSAQIQSSYCFSDKRDVLCVFKIR